MASPMQHVTLAPPKPSALGPQLTPTAFNGASSVADQIAAKLQSKTHKARGDKTTKSLKG
jgi:hypothetical protein